VTRAQKWQQWIEQWTELHEYLAWVMKRAAYSIEDKDPKEIRDQWMEEMHEAAADWDEFLSHR